MIVPCNNKRKKISILDPYTKVIYNGTATMKPKFNRTKRNRTDCRPNGKTTTTTTTTTITTMIR